MEFNPSDKIYEELARYETDHWWYKALRQHLFYWVRQLFPIPSSLASSESSMESPIQILDAGCGTGINALLLQNMGFEVTALDVSEVALNFAKDKGVKNVVQHDLRDLSKFYGKYNCVLSMDSLGPFTQQECQEILGEFNKCLKLQASKGTPSYLIINTTALPWLYSNQDRHWNFRKRYYKGELNEMLEDAGFEVVRSTYRIFFLFPLAAGVKMLENLNYRLTSKMGDLSDISKTNAFVNAMFFMVLSVENFLGRFVTWPIGSSIFVVAKKVQQRNDS